MTARGGAGPARQLPLGVRLNPSRRLDNFVPGRDGRVLDALDALVSGALGGHVLLLGAAGTGKTHLLQGCCARAAERGQRVAYLPLAAPEGIGPALLHGMESAHLLCVDDVDRVAGDAAWERALFRLYNEADAAGARLVFSARRGPAAFSLADLGSRLAAALALRLSAPDDTHRAAVLRAQAGERGLALTEDAVAYILARQPRDLARLVALLDELDRYALATQRRVTAALVREYLGQARAD